MTFASSRADTGLAGDLWSAAPSSDMRSGDPGGRRAAARRPSAIRRGLRALIKFVIVLCMGIGGTLGWQSYGDTARDMLANSSPQLAWLAPQAQPTPRSAPETVAAAAPMPAVPSADLQQLKDTSMGLAVLRQRVDQIAVQVAAGQQQMADEIAKLHAAEQDIQQKIAAQAPRASAAPVRRPVPLTPAGSTASAH